MKALVSIVILVTACTTTSRTRGVEPLIVWPLPDGAATVAHVPGTRVDIPVEWTALCTSGGWLPDTSSTEPCDEQNFKVTVHCAGAPCEIDPPEANMGLSLVGTGQVGVHASNPGDMTIEVILEHLESHEQLSRSGQLVIRDLETAIVDCVDQAYDPANPRCEQMQGSVSCRDVPWTACPDVTTVDPTWGTPISIWVYGAGGGYPIAPEMVVPSAISWWVPPRAQVTFSGFEPQETDFVGRDHLDDRAGQVARKFQIEPKTAGQIGIDVTVDGLTATKTMRLVTP